MQITLLKDHETPDGLKKAGETIEVSETEYDWLMSVYLQDRKELTATAEEFDKKLKPLRKKK